MFDNSNFQSLSVGKKPNEKGKDQRRRPRTFGFMNLECLICLCNKALEGLVGWFCWGLEGLRADNWHLSLGENIITSS